jgi:DNA (cytosine-5)-methyltransferase 1
MRRLWDGGAMTAYYNEIDPYAAQWLRNLIDAGHIAPGIVDERSIEDVYPSDLRGFAQCHFFAGIGVWSHALRSAGWGDDRPVWTGSCPCQPFSAAGKGSGFDDERHLWPAFHHLIKECSPAIVLGEQVASKDADPWIDLVCADVEAMGYAFGAIPFPSAGIGAPHIRDRLYWMADSAKRGRGEECSNARRIAAGDCSERRPARPMHGSSARGMADANGGNASAKRQQRSGEQRQQPEDGLAGPVGGFWADADWIACRDDKWRPVEPGTFPLAHGATSRMGRLRAYGNAINAEAARVWIESVMEAA